MEPFEVGKLDDWGRANRYAFGPGHYTCVMIQLQNTASDADTLTLTPSGGSATVFELDNNATYTAGRVQVAPSDLTIANLAPALATAINNANIGLRAASFTIGAERRVVIWEDAVNASAFAAAESISGANNTLNATTSVNGNAGVGVKVASVSRSLASSAEALNGAAFVFPFTVNTVLCQVRDANGNLREGAGGVSDYLVTVTAPSGFGDNVVTVTDGSTMTLANGDIVTLTVFGY